MKLFRAAVQSAVVLTLCVANEGCAPAPPPRPPEASLEKPFLGALRFDPNGADFSAWAQVFKAEIYRTWRGAPGPDPTTDLMAVIQFVVRRDGSVTETTVVTSSGSPRFDGAAQRALYATALAPLPPDYSGKEIRMTLQFHHLAAPDGRAG
jgi:TonB family protein